MSLLALLLAVAVGPQDASWLESGLVRTVELESRPGAWAAYLRLDREGAPSGSAPIGLLRYVAGPDPEGGVHVDLELQFLGGGVRVLHSEQAAFGRRRLVFREVCAGAGRTLLLEGGPSSVFQGYELGPREVVRHTDAGCGELPLMLVESSRLGYLLPDEGSVLDPLSASFESVRLLQRDEGDARILEARRMDGSLRWRVTFQGSELAEWRFQERGPVARGVSREEFQRLIEAHEVRTREAREAASGPPSAVLRR